MNYYRKLAIMFLIHYINNVSCFDGRSTNTHALHYKTHYTYSRH